MSTKKPCTFHVDSKSSDGTILSTFNSKFYKTKKFYFNNQNNTGDVNIKMSLSTTRYTYISELLFNNKHASAVILFLSYQLMYFPEPASVFAEDLKINQIKHVFIYMNLEY